MKNYTLHNGQPALKEIGKFIANLRIDCSLRRELSYDWQVHHIFFSSKREWIRNKFPDFPTKKLKQIEILIS